MVSSVADLERFDVDTDPDPTFQADTDPDPNPYTRVRNFVLQTNYCFLSLPKLVMCNFHGEEGPWCGRGLFIN